MISALRSRFSYFNPRSPRGERLLRSSGPAGCLVFQSTLPARGATLEFLEDDDEREFQSTLPARGATVVDAGIV